MFSMSAIWALWLANIRYRNPEVFLNHKRNYTIVFNANLKETKYTLSSVVEFIVESSNISIFYDSQLLSIYINALT